MILGIKYCGGCNPTYDRGAAVAELKKDLSDLEVSDSPGRMAIEGYPEGISFAPYDEKQQFDCCLLVRGCNRSCVSDQKFSNCKCFYVASAIEDFTEIKRKLRAQLTNDAHAE